MDRFQHYIDGRFEDAAEVFDSIDPANGIPWARMPAASAADMCRAVEAADRAFADWAATTATARGKLLYRLADLVQECFKPNEVTISLGGPELAAAFSALPLDHLVFTGSTAIGRRVMEAAARNLTPVTLELGGKSPTLVMADFPQAEAVSRIVSGKFLNAGQTCIAPDYVLVSPHRRDQLVERIVDVIRTHYGTNPLSSPDLAAVVNERHLARLRGLLTDHGGVIATGGNHDAVTRRFAPTVVVDPTPDSALMADEIFGPILPVLSVEDLDAAIRFVNDRPKPLALYVFGEDETGIDRVVARTSSGGVCVNHVMFQVAPPELPFGGVGNSGWGRYHGRAGLEALSNMKPVYKRAVKPDISLIYPPYTRLKERLLSM